MRFSIFPRVLKPRVSFSVNFPRLCPSSCPLTHPLLLNKAFQQLSVQTQCCHLSCLILSCSASPLRLRPVSHSHTHTLPFQVSSDLVAASSGKSSVPLLPGPAEASDAADRLLPASSLTPLFTWFPEHHGSLVFLHHAGPPHLLNFSNLTCPRPHSLEHFHALSMGSGLLVFNTFHRLLSQVSISSRP